MRTSRIVHGLLGIACAVALPVVAQEAPYTADPEAWRSTQPEQPAVVLVRGATVWTQGPQGVLENADLLVRRGKVAAVGSGLEAPADAVVIDAAGRHVTPGLIDAHSHIAIRGDVNEGSDVVTSEVRVADVVDPGDPDIYRNLAGGLTTSHLLHGSANAIGGQNAIIKLRWGAPAEELVFDGAPPGIKFALGENPKRSRRAGDDEGRRYPETRQGVAEVILDAFERARDYRRARQANPATRRDLRMEALVEILEGKRQIHAHSYRQDEILVLLRLAEEQGVKVTTLQHVLEGYKVADEIAAHGAGASTFSDWWAYKYEVVDAIPTNGALMHERGVLVSFNSDSGELARRMNLEAAKAVRYGGLAEPEALHFVTLNPARQLGIADRVGSLEPGKDADFVIWSGHPLSTYSVCEETWIDGRRYFDRRQDLAQRPRLAAEREALIAKVRAERGKKKTKQDDMPLDLETPPVAVNMDATPPPPPEWDDDHGHPHGEVER